MQLISKILCKCQHQRFNCGTLTPSPQGEEDRLTKCLPRGRSYCLPQPYPQLSNFHVFLLYPCSSSCLDVPPATLPICSNATEQPPSRALSNCGQVRVKILFYPCIRMCPEKAVPHSLWLWLKEQQKALLLTSALTRSALSVLLSSTRGRVGLACQSLLMFPKRWVNPAAAKSPSTKSWGVDCCGVFFL